MAFIGAFDASATPEMGGGGFNFRRAEQVMEENDARSLAVLKASIASHGSLWKFAGLLARKFAKYWQWYEEPDNQNLYYFRLYSRVLRWSLTAWLLAPLMLVGLVLALKRFERCAMLYALEYLHHNQRMVNRIYSQDLGQCYYVLQIADYDVDCVTPFSLKQNQPAAQGERFSQIRYGSQVELIVPLSSKFDFTLLQETGDHVEAGIDPLIKITERTNSPRRNNR